FLSTFCGKTQPAPQLETSEEVCYWISCLQYRDDHQAGPSKSSIGSASTATVDNEVWQAPDLTLSERSGGQLEHVLLH
ncbi:unnamed protein product, partial [Amoebophrya sp. A120]